MSMEPSTVERCSMRILSLSPLGGSIMQSSVFLAAAKPSPCSLVSTALFPCPKSYSVPPLRIRCLEVMFPVGQLHQCSACALHDLLRASSTYIAWRSSVSPGHMVHTFQFAGQESFVCFVCYWPGACLWPACWAIDSKLQAPTKAGRPWQVSILLTGGCQAWGR